MISTHSFFGILFTDRILWVWLTILQADVVRKLKEEGRPKIAIQGAVAELKVRKKALEKREEELTPKVTRMDRSGLEDLLKRRFFYTQSFSIYGGLLLAITHSCLPYMEGCC